MGSQKKAALSAAFLLKNLSFVDSYEEDRTGNSGPFA